MKVRSRAALVAVCVAPILASCSGGGDPTGATSSQTQTSAATVGPEDDAEVTSEAPVDDPTGTAAGGPVALDLTAASCPEEPVREPNELEASLLVEPGPFAGEAFDLEQVVSAVRSDDPSDVQSWHNSIVNQIHGDYLSGVCHNLLYSSDLGDASAGPTEGTPPQEVVGQNHFAVVLDASGSMEAQSGTGTRMDAAKAAIQGFADDLPAGSTLSLRVYGHQGTNDDAGKAESCESSEVIFEGTPDEAALGTVLEEVRSVGWTPLAKAIRDSAGDISQDSSDAIVYVVTDGLETCGGDPVKAAEELAAEGVEPVVNVIGFEVGNADQQALRSIAEAGRGRYTAVDSGNALEDYWKQENARMARAWSEWRDSELERIREQTSQQVDEGFDNAAALRDVTKTEREQARDVVAALESEGLLDREIRIALYDLISERERPIRVYAGERRAGDFAEGRVSLREYEQAVNELSSDKWTDYYRQGQD